MPVTIARIEIGLDPQLQGLLPLLLQVLPQLLLQKEVLDRIEQKVDQIIMTDAELKTLLTKVDDTTNKLATNVQAIADVDQKISDEIDALLNQPGNQLTPDVAAQLQGFADRLQATSDASDAQVAVLQAIAAKGAPVVPPPPPPPPVG